MQTDPLPIKEGSSLVARPEGAASVNAIPHATAAFVHPREIRRAVDRLRLIPGYCLGEGSLRDRGLGDDGRTSRRLQSGYSASAKPMRQLIDAVD
jgi:hypothetical protein